LLPLLGEGALVRDDCTYNYDTRFLSGELMYTARVLYKIAGNPGYGRATS